jgi:hypothetical protein
MATNLTFDNRGLAHINGVSLLSYSFNDLNDIFHKIATTNQQQNDIINKYESNQHKLKTMLHNLDNEKLSDSEFRDFVKTFEFDID